MHAIMQDWREDLWERANLFAAENGRSLIGQLGHDYDGKRIQLRFFVRSEAAFRSELMVAEERRRFGGR